MKHTFKPDPRYYQSWSTRTITRLECLLNFDEETEGAILEKETRDKIEMMLQWFEVAKKSSIQNAELSVKANWGINSKKMRELYGYFGMNEPTNKERQIN